MLEYDRIDISVGIDINKTNESKEFDICHYWYSLDKGFNYEPYLYNCFYDLMQKAMDFNDVVIVSNKESNCRIHFWYMSKYNAINIMKNYDLKKAGHYNFFSLLVKVSEKNYCESNRKTVLNRAK